MSPWTKLKQSLRFGLSRLLIRLYYWQFDFNFPREVITDADGKAPQRVLQAFRSVTHFNLADTLQTLAGILKNLES